MIRGLHHVALHTANLERIVKFYTEGLRFEVATPVNSWANAPDFDKAIDVPGSAARTVMLKAGNCYLEVFEYSAPPARDGQPLRPNDHGYTHFALDVKDIEEEMAHLKKHGMTFPADAPLAMDNLKAIYGKDPDGNVIELQEVTEDQSFSLEQLGTVNFSR